MGLVNQPAAVAPYEGISIASQVKNAGKVYAANAQYAPLYSQLNEEDLASMLNGSNGQPGFLSEYQNSIMPALTAAQTTANTATRTANLNDAANLTPQYLANERAANPGAAGLLDNLTSNANRDLSYGTELTPAEKTQLNQSVRGGEAARGMGNGPADVFDESMADTGFGQSLYQQRQGEAQGLVPTLQNFWGNPTAAISGMGSSGGMSASQLTTTGAGLSAPSQSSEFNPNDAENQLMMTQQFEGAMGAAQGAGKSLTSMSSM